MEGHQRFPPVFEEYPEYDPAYGYDYSARGHNIISRKGTGVNVKAARWAVNHSELAYGMENVQHGRDDGGQQVLDTRFSKNIVTVEHTRRAYGIENIQPQHGAGEQRALDSQASNNIATLEPTRRAYGIEDIGPEHGAGDQQQPSPQILHDMASRNTRAMSTPPNIGPKALLRRAQAAKRPEQTHLEYDWPHLAVQSRGSRGRRSSSNAARPSPRPQYRSGFDAQPGRYSFRSRSHTDPLAILRDHEVPYVEAFSHVESVGSATGTPLHSPSYDGVNVGGYPVPTDHPFYTEIVAAASHKSGYFPARQHRAAAGSVAQAPKRPIIPPTIPPFFDAVREWNKAIELFQNGDIWGCHNISCEIIKRPETTVPHSRIHYNTGIIWARSRDIKSAATAFEKATELEPALTIAWFCLGVCLYDLRRIGQSMDAYNTALEQYEVNRALKEYGATFTTIDYIPAGLAVKLQKTEIAFDKDLCFQAFAHYREPKWFNIQEIFKYVEGDDGRPVQMMDEHKQGARRSSVVNSIKKIFGRGGK